MDAPPPADKATFDDKATFFLSTFSKSLQAPGWPCSTLSQASTSCEAHAAGSRVRQSSCVSSSVKVGSISAGTFASGGLALCGCCAAGDSPEVERTPFELTALVRTASPKVPRTFPKVSQMGRSPSQMGRSPSQIRSDARCAAPPTLLLIGTNSGIRIASESACRAFREAGRSQRACAT